MSTVVVTIRRECGMCPRRPCHACRNHDLDNLPSSSSSTSSGDRRAADPEGWVGCGRPLVPRASWPWHDVDLESVAVDPATQLHSQTNHLTWKNVAQLLLVNVLAARRAVEGCRPAWACAHAGVDGVLAMLRCRWYGARSRPRSRPAPAQRCRREATGPRHVARHSDPPASLPG